MPARKRHDPPQTKTPVDGGEITADMTSGKDPDRHYVYVNPVALAGVDQVGMYEGMGFEIEKYRPGGPRPLSVSSRLVKDGADITSSGQVLMSCPKSEHDRRKAAGEAMAQAYDKRMLSKGELDDGFRGGNGFRVRAHAGSDRDVDSRLGGFENG
jgi:hypothetical protein